MTKIAISVIIPTYNSQATISECLQSVFNQTCKPDEIIIVDDGSTDSTLSIVEELAKTDNIPIKIYSQENAGPGQTRNNAVTHATCPWVAFLDSDDTWADSRVQKQIELLDKYPQTRFLYSNFSLTGSAPKSSNSPCIQNDSNLNNKKENLFIGNYLDACRKGYFAFTSSVLIEKEVFNKAGGFGNNRTGEDTDLWCRLGIYDYPSLFDFQCMVNYRTESYMNYDREINISQYICQFNNLYSLAKQNNKSSEFLPVAKILIQELIRQLNFQKNTHEITNLLDNLEIPLNKNFIREEKLKAKNPALMGNLFSFYHKLKRLFK